MSNERLMDLVRYARHHLFTENLISNEEYAALVFDSDNGQRVARLESYDEVRSRISALESEVTRLKGELWVANANLQNMTARRDLLRAELDALRKQEAK